MYIIFILIYLQADQLDSSSADWYYPNYENGEIENWGGLCSTGSLQSPILIQKKKTLTIQDEMNYFGYHGLLDNIVLENTGKTLRLDIRGNSDIELAGGLLGYRYVFDHMHWHWSAEHSFNNSALELQIIHRLRGTANLEEAVQGAHGVVILSSLYNITSEESPPLATILQYISDIQNASSSVTLRRMFRLIDFLPMIRDQYFAYIGSLTNPPCSENVLWFVYNNPISITRVQVNKFRELRKAHGDSITHNNRLIKPTNNRDLVLIIEKRKAAEKSCYRQSLTGNFDMVFKLICFLQLFEMYKKLYLA